jgi:hypothetical protein
MLLPLDVKKLRKANPQQFRLGSTDEGRTDGIAPSVFIATIESYDDDLLGEPRR